MGLFQILNSSFLLAIVCASHLAGCASPLGVDPDDEKSVSEAVKVDRDDFKKRDRFLGPIVSNEIDDGSGSPEVEDISLYAVKDQDKPIRYFLRIIDYYEGDWRGFDQAYDLSGNKFHALPIRHKVKCTFLCGFDEIIEVELSRKYLDDHMTSGITMKLYGPSSSSSAAFHIPPMYILGFLKGSYSY